MTSLRRGSLFCLLHYFSQYLKKIKIKKNAVTPPLLICHLYTSFTEMSVRDFDPFSNFIVHVFV